ncbi:Sec20 [Aphelenchoides bicaudatus]|nr:Sec20 [Aphelenchoides bicaudatus]
MHYRKPIKQDSLITKNREEQEQRDALLKPSRSGVFSKRTERRDRQARVDAKETTKNLSSLVQRMGDEVRLSEQSTMILTTSSSTLKDTGLQMNAIGQSIKSGGKLITKYGRRELTDKILLFMALLLYFGVIIYILKKRVFTFPFMDY